MSVGDSLISSSLIRQKAFGRPRPSGHLLPVPSKRNFAESTRSRLMLTCNIN